MNKLVKNPIEVDIYKAFQDVQNLIYMFGTSSKTHTFSTVIFNKVAGDSHELPNSEEVKQSRFSVWKTGDLYVKLTGYVTSYGEYDLVFWKFVQPLEKTVVVYE